MGDAQQFSHTKVFSFCAANDIPVGGRKTRTSGNGRTITVIRLSETEFTAMDSLCYHMAGQLAEAGDIEDYHGATCLTCPEHRHRIDVRTGIRADIPENHRDYGKVLQRVFRCMVDPADGAVKVELTAVDDQDPACGTVTSDKNNLPWLNRGLADPNTPAGARGCLTSLTTYTFDKPIFDFTFQPN